MPDPVTAINQKVAAEGETGEVDGKEREREGQEKKASINTAGITKNLSARGSKIPRPLGTHKEAVINVCTLARARSHGREHGVHAQFRRNKRERSYVGERNIKKTRRAQSDGAARVRDGTQGKEEGRGEVEERHESRRRESEIGRQKEERDRRWHKRRGG